MIYEVFYKDNPPFFVVADSRPLAEEKAAKYLSEEGGYAIVSSDLLRVYEWSC